MPVSDDRRHRLGLHPLHGVLLAGTIPLFLGGLLCDLGYWASYEIQWTHFSSWLIAGANVFGGFALLWAIISLVRAEYRGGLPLIYTLLLLVTWVLGFINSLVHAKDAWAAMPEGLVLSVIAVVLSCVATWIGFAKFGVGGGR